MTDANKALPPDFEKNITFKCSSSNIPKYLYCWTKLFISKPILKTLSVFRNRAFRKYTILDLDKVINKLKSKGDRISPCLITKINVICDKQLKIITVENTNKN